MTSLGHPPDVEVQVAGVDVGQFAAVAGPAGVEVQNVADVVQVVVVVVVVEGTMARRARDSGCPSTLFVSSNFCDAGGDLDLDLGWKGIRNL